MATAAAAGAISAFVSVAGTAVSMQQQHKSTTEQRKQQRIQERMADVEARRQRQAQLRQARVQKARVQNVATQTGTGGSAGALGAVDAISSQTNSNLSFLDTQRSFAGQASSAGQRAANAQQRAGMAAGITQMALPYADFAAFK